MASSYDLAPPIDPQVLRNVRRALMREEEEAPPLSVLSGAFAACLRETTIDALRQRYSGFDAEPSSAIADALAGKKKAVDAAARAGADGNNTNSSNNANATEKEAAAGPSKAALAFMSGGGAPKRARSPTTTVSAVLEDDGPSTTTAADSSSAATFASTAKAPSSRAAFEPFAEVAAPDYQGRSYLFPPTTAGPSAALAGAKECRVPRRMLGVGSGHSDAVHVLRWAEPQAHLVFSGDAGGVVKAWNPSSAATMRGAVATFSGHSLPVTAIESRDGGRLLSTSSHDGFIRRWDAEVGALTGSLVFRGGGVGCSEHVLHPENDNLVLGAFGRAMALFDVREASSASGRPQSMFEGHMAAVTGLTFLSPRGLLFASSSSDKTVRTWDFRVPLQIRQLGDPTMHAVSHIIKHPHRDVLLAQSSDNKVRTIDCDDSGRLRLARDRHFSGHTVSGTSCKLAMSHDGQYLSSGDATGQVFVWSFATAEVVRKFAAHSKQCSAHLWHPHEVSKMVTGGSDRMVKAWV